MKPDKNKITAWVVTLIFHGILIAVLMLLALHTPLPLPGEQGVEVNLGNTGAAFGKKALKTVSKITPAKKQTQPRHSSPAPASKVSQNKDLTQNIEKAPALLPKSKPAKKKTQKPLKKKAEKRPLKKSEKEAKKNDTIIQAKLPATKPKPVVNRRALFKVASGNLNQSQGIKPGNGDMGKPHGFKESKAYNGQGGQGQGISFSLGNRGAKFLEKPAARFAEQGTVVVRIEVNPKGEVIRARVNAKGTTVVSERLRKLAVASAKKSLFSADPAAPAVQIGTITYHFILKR